MRLSDDGKRHLASLDAALARGMTTSKPAATGVTFLPS